MNMIDYTIYNKKARLNDDHVKTEIEKEIGYLLENKAEFEREIRVGENAKIGLKETEKQLQARMVVWLGINEGEI